MEVTVPAAGRVTLGVPRETAENERRVALIPDAVKRYTDAGHTVFVQSGAGLGSFFSDDAYTAVGGTIVPDAARLYGQSDLVLKVAKPTGAEIKQMRPGTGLVAFLSPMTNPELVEQLLERQITSFSMDAIPRTTRAQSMDALSSQATIAGYKAVLLAADYLAKFFPLLMTAAGTIPPAKVLIIGAGVAGLQAIATARRLGAVVEAYDARSVVKEQIESLGAKYVEIDTGADLAGSGGYAKEAGEEVLRKQQAGLAARAARSDVIITTAAVPGRPAPRLITEDAVKQMPPGSVIVDLAAETGGNCALTVPGEVVERNGVTIIGLKNLPGLLPIHASQMYAKNLQNLLALLIDKDGTLTLNMDDDIVAGTVITDNGDLIHEGARARMMPATAPSAPPAAPAAPVASAPPVATPEPSPVAGTSPAANAPTAETDKEES
ncbi:MAG: Re/Si-specific NAD(P)(+) transhydrogenase subunit alpha [Thermomicrobiales bacterium]